MTPGTAVLYSQNQADSVSVGDIFRVTEITRGGYARLMRIQESDLRGTTWAQFISTHPQGGDE